MGVVALLAEGVDRNAQDWLAVFIDMTVALLAEGVDRNLRGLVLFGLILGRPPRGGRG